MSKTLLIEKVRGVVAKELRISVDSLCNDSEFSDYGGDSLDHVEIVMVLEEHFNIEIDDCVADGLTTVSAIVSYLLKREVK